MNDCFYVTDFFVTILYDFSFHYFIDEFFNCLNWEYKLGMLFLLCRLYLIFVFSLFFYPTLLWIYSLLGSVIAKNKYLVSWQEQGTILIAFYIGFLCSCRTSSLIGCCFYKLFKMKSFHFQTKYLPPTHTQSKPQSQMVSLVKSSKHLRRNNSNLT